MAGRLVELAGWLATQVFDVVGSVAGVQGADGGTTVDLQVGKTVFFDVPVKVRGERGMGSCAGSWGCAGEHPGRATRAAVCWATAHARHLPGLLPRLQMRTELWLSQLHRKASDGTTPSAGEYYDLLFEVCGRVWWAGVGGRRWWLLCGSCVCVKIQGMTTLIKVVNRQGLPRLIQLTMLPACLRLQKLSPDVLAEIDKDTHRTFPGHTWWGPALPSPCLQPVLPHGPALPLPVTQHCSWPGRGRLTLSRPDAPWIPPAGCPRPPARKPC